MIVYDAAGRVLGYVDARRVWWQPGLTVCWDKSGRVLGLVHHDRPCVSPDCSCSAFTPSSLLSSCASCKHHVEDHAWPSVTSPTLINKEAN